MRRLNMIHPVIQAPLAGGHRGSFESGVPEAYKQAILKAREHETRLTRVFSGRPARGVSRPRSSSHGSPGKPTQPCVGWRRRVDAPRNAVATACPGLGIIAALAGR